MEKKKQKGSRPPEDPVQECLKPKPGSTPIKKARPASSKRKLFGWLQDLADKDII
jgi:hypothetical protein